MTKTGIKAVAMEAGVSIGTVSKAFSSDESLAKRISEDTRRRIFGVAQKLNYTPNYGATLMRGQSSKTIGVALSLPSEQRASYNSNYTARLLNGIGEDVEKLGYQLLLMQNQNYRSYMDIKRIDALIIIGFRVINNPLREEMLSMFRHYNERQYPYIIINCNDTGDLELPSITVDNRDGMRQIAELILRRNYQSVGFVGELTPNPQYQHQQRMEYLDEFLKAANVDFPAIAHINGCGNGVPEIPRAGLYSHADGITAMKYLCEKNALPRCLVCGNDDIAHGVLKYCYDHKIRIPEDLAVIGFDGTPEAEFYTPSLTTVNQPLEEFGRMAVENLIRRMERPGCIESIFVRPKLIERQST